MASPTARRILLQQWQSLDGFAAGPNGEIDWFVAPQASKYSDEEQLELMRRRVGTILLGAHTYRLFVDFWPTPKSRDEILAEFINTTPKVVVSNTLSAAPWGEQAPATVLRGDPVSAVRELKQQAGKDIVLWGSLTLTRALFTAQLIDEVHLRLCPVTLGAGQRLFPSEGRIDLALKRSVANDVGVVTLEYDRAAAVGAP